MVWSLAVKLLQEGGSDAEAWLWVNRLKTLSKSRKRGER
jgi:hypothetical protein